MKPSYELLKVNYTFSVANINGDDPLPGDCEALAGREGDVGGAEGLQRPGQRVEAVLDESHHSDHARRSDDDAALERLAPETAHSRRKFDVRELVRVQRVVLLLGHQADFAAVVEEGGGQHVFPREVGRHQAAPVVQQVLPGCENLHQPVRVGHQEFATGQVPF